MNYTESEINEFQQKDKRIMFQSIFSSLCNYHGQLQEKLQISIISAEAFDIVKKLVETYPMKAISQTIKNRAGGSPF